MKTYRPAILQPVWVVTGLGIFYYCCAIVPLYLLSGKPALFTAWLVIGCSIIAGIGLLLSLGHLVAVGMQKKLNSISQKQPVPIPEIQIDDEAIRSWNTTVLLKSITKVQYQLFSCYWNIHDFPEGWLPIPLDPPILHLWAEDQYYQFPNCSLKAYSAFKEHCPNASCQIKHKWLILLILPCAFAMLGTVIAFFI